MIGKPNVDASDSGVANTGTARDIITGITLNEYRAALKEELAEQREHLETAHGAERDVLTNTIATLESKLANIEQDYEQTLIELAQLKEQLKNYSNTFSADQMAAALTALDNGDRSKADELLEQVELAEQAGIERAANAAYIRGNIAEQEIRWADAAKHYANAARLDPNFKHLRSAQEFLHRSGDTTKAVAMGDDLISAAITEHGRDSTEHATALNNHAAFLEAQGKYADAEPLYYQALEIDKATIGVDHPNYAIRLNNLAELYRAQGKYSDAEPLFQQALEIDKATIGLEHPEYAKHLNNLATLYHAQGKYADSEPLYQQAIAICAARLPADHPQTQGTRENYAIMQAERDKG